MSERETATGGTRRSRAASRAGVAVLTSARAGLVSAAAALCALLVVACFESPAGERYYGEVSIPRSQELRWSSGGLPRVFDPARAAAPPDTDAVRALYEGLTDYEPKTLRPIPAVAREWETEDDGRTWLFRLREDARWSNGDAVTARDFVRSWRRTLRLGDGAPHVRLLAGIAGAAEARQGPPATGDGQSASGAADVDAAAAGRPAPEQFGAVALDAHTLRVTLKRPDPNFPALVAHPVFRPVHELSPPLELPSHPEDPFGGVLRGDLGLVTNGAFRLSEVSGRNVVLERDADYWDARSVRLKRVTFVDGGDAEGALAAYRAGEVDAVTNAAFEPLALKLLAPYEDFRRQTFAALNFYRFNTTRPPFDDRRVREAFALALDADRLAADVLGGAVQSAHRYLPFGDEPAATPPEAPHAAGDEGEAAAPQDVASEGAAAPSGESSAAQESRPSGEGTGESESAGAPRDDSVGEGNEGAAERGAENSAGQGDGGSPSPGDDTLSPSDGPPASGDGTAGAAGRGGAIRPDAARAARLLAEAGYPNGQNFPRVRLLINRNEQQRIVANAVARMWRETLGVETEVVVRPWEEYEVMLRTGDYDIVRRSVVMQTLDESANLLAILGEEPVARPLPAASPQNSPQTSPAARPEAGAAAEARAANGSAGAGAATQPLTEAEALRELPAIPLYFASSYALVRPYVVGFESNLLDAPSLKHVSINTAWAPPTPKQQPAAVTVPRR
ncbi:MAG TPA: peptide ABC transporter substrate-binding protein [Pyrinomonadaceae bacterium]|nr:peptide ABC transporter substrate-binding protein [Pyrinomonadaceae bacterium]